MERPKFEDIVNKMIEMQKKKGSDYGSNNDPLGNLLESIDFGIPPWVATMVRANDKMSRIKTFVRKGSLNNESVKDSLIDLAVYTVHALRLFMEFEKDK